MKTSMRAPSPSSLALLGFALLALLAPGFALHGLADSPSSPERLDDDGGSALRLSLSFLLLHSLTLSPSRLHDLRVLELQHSEVFLQLAQLRPLLLIGLRQTLQLRLRARTSENSHRNTGVKIRVSRKTLYI